MNKTKIDWADSSWNPVTGCLHGCEYCYAQKIANRFGGNSYGDIGISLTQYMDTDNMHVVKKPHDTVNRRRWRFAPYPFGFEPTLHEYRLEEPAQMKKPQTIFVCSMADLFGKWVPDEWISEVFEACAAAPQHRYLFLTKNPGRFRDVFLKEKLHISKNMWFGFSVEDQAALNKIAMGARCLPQNSFVSIEPLHGPIDLTRIEPNGIEAYLNFLNGGQYWLMGGDDKGKKLNWIIVGAETGNRKGKVIPEREWIMDIKRQCTEAGVPLFMKASLHDLMGDEFIQQYPWETAK